MNRSFGLPRDLVGTFLATTFPQLHLLRAEIAKDLRQRALLPADVGCKSFFGDLVERALGLALCDQPPYEDLLSCLTDGRAATLLACAGYRPGRTAMPAGYDQWHRTDGAAQPFRIFSAAHRLASIHALLHPRYQSRIDSHVIAGILRCHPDALRADPSDVDREWRAFNNQWTSYTRGFHQAFRGYGPATAQLALSDGQRHADFLLGSTILEVKTGRLDHANALDDLVRQLVTYPLLARHDGHPVTHVAVYGTRYQRLLCWPIEPLLERLAGAPVDIAATGARLAAVIHTDRHHRLAA